MTTATTKTTVKTDLNFATSTFTAYPSISVSDGGVLSLSGTAVTVNASNISNYTSYYCEINGLFYKIGACTKTAPTSGTTVHGGTVSVNNASRKLFWQVGPFTHSGASSYSELKVTNGSVSGYGNPTVYERNNMDDYPLDSYSVGEDGKMYQCCSCYDGGEDTVTWQMYGYPVDFVGNDSYAWEFYAVTAETNSSDTEVKGIWSGYVNGTEYIVAACNGHLWSLTVSDGVWTKTDIGTISTSGKVLLFGFGNKLYVLDGTDYKAWDGTTLSSVSGYAPIVATATPPSGGGTLLEQANKLTGSKRQQFSPDGTATTFQLSEKDVASVDFVKVNGAAKVAATDYTVNLTNGTVTFVTAPAEGINTVEIKWTKGSGDRTAALAMRYCEFFNGTNEGISLRRRHEQSSLQRSRRKRAAERGILSQSQRDERR